MQFIRLRLNGFKSFVDQTDLAIQEGLTGVVGPNGCGKSNLLEALRWVMGESRPKSMRGGGMEDVIFAGTATRPARSFAEVSLQVDNAERLAPAAFNDADAIEIVRRITRDAGSAYKAAGRDVRARDVQMLFADASTGAQSPALVRQGQIAELIGARPTTRRRVLEEAAGISGLYQRRHEAELKLGGAEANLARLDDVIEQLAARRAQLARQARQAARYREVGAALRRAEGMLLHRRWREAEAAREAAGDALAARSAEAAGAEREAAAAVRTREAAEAAPPALREEAAIAAAVLSRLEADRARLADRARRAEEATQRLSGRLEQLGRDATREAALNDDADETIGRLEAEADALAAAEAGSETALAAARQAARQAGERLEACELALAAVSEDAARLSARHDASARAIEAARADGARAEAAAGSARSGVAEADAALAGAAEAQSGAEAERGAAEVEGQRAEAAQRDAETAQIGAREAEAGTRIRRAEHEAERGAVQAEAAALAALLDREGGGGGRLIDLVEVAPGFEAALGAALADDLDQPVVESGTGWVRLADYDAVEPLPEGAAPLAARVRGPVVLARRIARVGVVEPASGPALQARLSPGQRLVSRAGDLWRWDGFVAAAQDGPGAAAVRLGQRNRLAELDRLRERASTRTVAAIAAHEAAEAALARADAAVEEARAARRGADGRLAAAERALGHAAAERTLAEGRRAQAATAVARHEDDAREAGLRLAEADAELRGLADPDTLRAEVADARRRVEAARTTMLARRADHDAQARAGEQRAARRSAIEEELATWRARRASASGRIEELAERRARTETELVAAREAPATLEAEGGRLAAALADAQARNAAAVEALTAGEGAVRQAAEAERAAERAAGAAREARAGAEAQAGAAGVAVAAAAARIAETLEETPAALERRLGEDADRMAPAADLEAELQRLRRQREGLGAINLRAEEDARAVEEEHGELVREKADLDSAIATLRAGIAGLNREGRERLRTAFETVNANFAGLFASLFGGGEARLELVESDDPLDAGLEILCQPPGKRLASLSLLSGGEQTLTAMALIFAVFLANPAPICVLDEVDAPLDDANVTRFCDLLDEMTRRTRTRFLIISHHAVTMARMDRLFGVTMGEQGVSQLVSVDLRRAEALVA